VAEGLWKSLSVALLTSANSVLNSSSLRPLPLCVWFSYSFLSSSCHASLATLHTHAHESQGRELRNFSQGKNGVRTGAVPTDTRSQSKIQTAQTPPSLGASPSRGYPPNAYFHCNPAANLSPFLFNALPLVLPFRLGIKCTHLSSNPNTPPFRPTTFFLLPACMFS